MLGVGDGAASVDLTATENASIRAFAARTMSDPSADAATGAELGMDPQAGLDAAASTRAGRSGERASGTGTRDGRH